MAGYVLCVVEAGKAALVKQQQCFYKCKFLFQWKN
jgi:hypothetical protein